MKKLFTLLLVMALSGWLIGCGSNPDPAPVAPPDSAPVDAPTDNGDHGGTAAPAGAVDDPSDTADPFDTGGPLPPAGDRPMQPDLGGGDPGLGPDLGGGFEFNPAPLPGTGNLDDPQPGFGEGAAEKEAGGVQSVGRALWRGVLGGSRD